MTYLSEPQQADDPGPVGLRIGSLTFDRPADELSAVAGLRTTDLSDATRKRGVMAGIKPVAGVTGPVAGFAVTVSVPVGGFDLVKLGLQLSRPGDVLVISTMDDGSAVWGGNLSRGAQARGLAGVVVDGAARDVEEIGQLGFPVFARTTCVSASPIDLPIGEVNVPVACGGTVVFPGDLVIGDEDGVIVVRPADLDAVLADLDDVLSGHQRLRDVLNAGRVTSIDRIVDRLEAAGMRIPDELRTSISQEAS